MRYKDNFNVEVNGVIIKDVAEKIGFLFGDEGKRLGRFIDALSKDITIKIGNNENDETVNIFDKREGI